MSESKNDDSDIRFLDIDIDKEECPSGGQHSIGWVDDHNLNVVHVFCRKCRRHGSEVCGALVCWGEILTEEELKNAEEHASSNMEQ